MTYFQNIHTLTLFEFGFGGTSSHKFRFVLPFRITFPHLRVLRLRGWVAKEIISILHPPRDLTVDVEDDEDARPGRILDSTSSLSGTEIAAEMTILRLELSASAAIQVGPSSIHELLKNAPCLKAVYLSPRAEVILGDGLEALKANYRYSCADGAWVRHNSMYA